MGKLSGAAMNKIGNDPDLIQSDSTSYSQNPKGTQKAQIDKTCTKDTHSKPNEQLFPKFRFPN